MSCIQDPNTEYEKYVKSIRHLTQKDELVLKEKIPWLYNLFHDLPVKRPRFDILSDFRPTTESVDADKIPSFDKFRHNSSGLSPRPRYYVCYDKESKRSYIIELQSDGSEKFSHWEMPSLGLTIERWFPGIKRYTL